MIVQVIERKLGAILVQWNENDEICRGIIPEELLESDGITVRDELLSVSIPYGVDWETLLEGVVGLVTPAIIAGNLRKAGIWTAEDVLSNSKAVLGAIHNSYHVDMSAIIQLAKNKIKEV